MTNENYQKLLSKLEKSFMSIEPFGSSGANGENIVPKIAMAIVCIIIRAEMDTFGLTNF